MTLRSNNTLPVDHSRLALLLSLSMDIPHIKMREDLNRFLRERVTSAFYFYHCTITTLCEDGLHFKAFLLDRESRVRTHQEYQHLITTRYPLHDGISDLPYETDRTVYVNLAEKASQAPLPEVCRIIYETGITEAAGIALTHDQQKFGILWFFSDRPGSFDTGSLSFIEQIGNLVAPAVAGIMATEKIAEQLQEREHQLQISNAIAQVKDRQGLLSVINQEAKSIFRFSHSVVLYKPAAEHDLSVFLLDPDSPGRHTAVYEQITSGKIAFRDGLLDAIFTGRRPGVIDIESTAILNKPPDYILMYQQIGIRELAVIPLYETTGAPIGALIFCAADKGTFTHRALDLMHAVSYHFATAVLNIISNEQIRAQVAEITRYREQLEEEKLYLQQEAAGGVTDHEMVGRGAGMQEIFQLLSQVTLTDTTVLLLGETGTGKEMIARAIHEGSPRRKRLMVKVNCAAIPDNLIESELFGHEKGSFTGAIERRIGKFELANHATLFLDEIGEMPLDMQAKLLRAIQEKEIERIGGKGSIKLDVRIIAATNKNLQEEVRNGRFRGDLYYRLNVFPITMPPLRSRKEDVPALVKHFLEKHARTTGRKIQGLSSSAMKELLAYDWPGNIRELEHLLERSILLTQGAVIKKVHIPHDKQTIGSAGRQDERLKSLEENERDHILKVLARCNGKISGVGGAADILQINYSTLNSRMRKLGIAKDKTVFRHKPDNQDQ